MVLAVLLVIPTSFPASADTPLAPAPRPHAASSVLELPNEAREVAAWDLDLAPKIWVPMVADHGEVAPIGDFDGDGIADFWVAVECRGCFTPNSEPIGVIVLGRPASEWDKEVNGGQGLVSGQIYVYPNVGGSVSFGRLWGHADFDNDDHEDLVIGDSNAFDGVAYGGAIYVIWGAARESFDTEIHFSGGSHFSSFPANGYSFEGLGTAGSIGDVTGDGAPDIVFSMRWTGWTYELVVPNNRIRPSFSGMTALWWATEGIFIWGSLDDPSLLANIDLDHDGFDDVLMSSSTNPLDSAGGILAMSGAAIMASPGIVSSTPGLLQTGGAIPKDSLVAGIIGIGDIDSDGIGDIALPISPTSSTIDPLQTGLLIVFGDPGLLTPGWIYLEDASHLLLQAERPEILIDFKTSAAGDVDADGFADLMVNSPLAGAPLSIDCLAPCPGNSAPGGVGFFHGAERSSLLASQAAPLVFTLVGHEGSSDRLGASAAMVGDIDGGGLPDLVVTAPPVELGLSASITSLPTPDSEILIVRGETPSLSLDVENGWGIEEDQTDWIALPTNGTGLISLTLQGAPSWVVLRRDPFDYLEASPTDGQVGSYSATIIASDHFGNRIERPFPIVVSDIAPTVGAEFPTWIGEGSSLEAPLWSDDDVAHGGRGVDWSVQQLSIIPDLRIDEHSILRGTPKVYGLSSNVMVPLAINVTATDSSGVSTSRMFDLALVGRDEPPVLLTTSLPSAVVGKPYHAPLLPSDPDSTISPDVAIVDGPSWLDYSSEARELQGTPPQGSQGTATVHLVITDISGQVAEANLPLSVTSQRHPPRLLDVPTDIVLTAGQPWRLVLRAEDDNQPSNLTFVLLDGPEGMEVQSQTGLIRWTPAASQLGQFPTRVRVEDGDLASLDSTIPLEVRPPEMGLVEPWVGPISPPSGHRLTAGSVTLRVTAGDPQGGPVNVTIYASEDLESVRARLPSCILGSGRGLTQVVWPELHPGGTYFWTASAVDLEGFTSTPWEPWAFHIDTPPVLAYEGELTARAGRNLTLRAVVSDPDTPEQLREFILIEQRDGLAIDRDNGTLTWAVPSHQRAGHYTLRVALTDDVQETPVEVDVVVTGADQNDPQTQLPLLTAGAVLLPLLALIAVVAVAVPAIRNRRKGV